MRCLRKLFLSIFLCGAVAGSLFSSDVLLDSLPVSDQELNKILAESFSSPASSQNLEEIVDGRLSSSGRESEFKRILDDLKKVEVPQEEESKRKNKNRSFFQIASSDGGDQKFIFGGDFSADLPVGFSLKVTSVATVLAIGGEFFPLFKKPLDGDVKKEKTPIRKSPRICLKKKNKRRY